MDLRLNDFIKLLEEERKKTGEENPNTYIGGKGKNGRTAYGLFELTSEESMFDRTRKDILITSKVQ